MAEQNVKEFMVETYERVKHLSAQQRNKEIISEVKKKFDVIITSDDVYEICVRTRRLRDQIKEMNDAEKKDKPYEVIDGHYVMVK